MTSANDLTDLSAGELSRALQARQLSCALAVLHDHWQRTGKSAVIAPT